MVEGFAARGLESTVLGAIDAWAPEIIRLRRQLHAQPELSFQEYETSRLLVELLSGWDIPCRLLPRGVGVIAELRRVPDAPWVALRADIDALAIDEKNDVPYRSRNPKVMHACGHDGHTACAVGALKGLMAAGFDLPGNVRVLFQPAEEVSPGGAVEMIEAGALEGVVNVFALHVAPEHQVGTIALKKGAMTASSDRIDIKIRGRSGHGARPHQAVDPIFIGAQIISALYHGMRRFDPREAAVLSIGMFKAGDSPNVIPEEAVLSGTVRTIRPETRPRLHDLIHRIVSDVTDMHDGQCEVMLGAGPPPVLNDDGANRIVESAASATIGAHNVSWIEEPSMGSEDFAEYQQRVPGAMFRLGVGSDRCYHGLHSANFDLEESALPIGAKVLAASALRALQRATGWRIDD